MLQNRASLLVAIGSAGAVAITGLAACSSSDKPTQSSASSSATATPEPVVPTRWWTDNAGAAGSKIDEKDPTAAAVSLKPDLPTYCQVLSDTVKSHNVFQNAAGTDPGIVVSTKAWVAEVSALAPKEVSDAWKAYGAGVIALVELGSKKTGAAFPSLPADWPASAKKINGHAKSACNVDLSSTQVSPSPSK